MHGFLEGLWCTDLFWSLLSSVGWFYCFLLVAAAHEIGMQHVRVHFLQGHPWVPFTSSLPAVPHPWLGLSPSQPHKGAAQTLWVRKKKVWFLNWGWTWLYLSHKNSQAKPHRNWASCWAEPVRIGGHYINTISPQLCCLALILQVFVLKAVRTRHLKIRILCQTVNTHKHAAFH